MNLLTSCRFPHVRACLLLGVLALTRVGSAQTIDELTSGVRYVLAFPSPLENSRAPEYQDPRYKGAEYTMFIYSAEPDNEVVVRWRNTENRLRLVPGMYLRFTFGMSGNPSPVLVDAAGRAVDSTIELITTKPVVVNCQMITPFGSESWVPLPVESWGAEYVVGSLPGQVIRDIDLTLPEGTRPKAAPALAIVVAAYDSTVVTIEPTGRLVGEPQTRSVLLNRGDAYRIESFVDTSRATAGGPQPDIGGTRISANRPIGVLGGNTRSDGLPSAWPSLGVAG